MPPFLHVAVTGPVLVFLLPDREVGRPRYHDGRNPRVNRKLLVHVFRQFAGIGIKQMVDFFMEHGVNPCFLFFRHSSGLIYKVAVFCGCAPFLIIIKAVHLFGAAGRCLVDWIVVDVACTSFAASGHAGPKSYRSSWEGPVFSFFGAGGASFNCFKVSRMECGVSFG